MTENDKCVWKEMYQYKVRDRHITKTERDLTESCDKCDGYKTGCERYMSKAEAGLR